MYKQIKTNEPKPTRSFLQKVHEHLTPGKTMGIISLVALWFGLLAVIVLVQHSQDLRQNATVADSVQLELQAGELASGDLSTGELITVPGKSIGVVVYSVPGNLKVSAVDFEMQYDPAFLEFSDVELNDTAFGVLLQREVHTTEGRVRVVVGRNPETVLTGNQPVARVLFTVKNKVGRSSIRLDASRTKVAAATYSNSVYSGSSTPISLVVAEPTTAASATLQLQFALAGTPVENNPAFLKDRAKSPQVKVSLQNMITGEIAASESLAGTFIVTGGTPRRFTLVEPWDSSSVATGKYNILVKGPMHQQIRFCKEDQSAEYQCSITDGIALTADTEHSLNLVAKPLACGDLPISGAGRDEQDGAVRVTDYSFMIGCLSKRSDAACVARADCNGDGSVTNLDMDLLLQTLSIAYDQ